jgi:hypothetical protein
MKAATRPIEERSAKGTLDKEVSKITSGIIKVAEELAELE